MRKLWTVAAVMVAVSFLSVSFLRAEDAPKKEQAKRPSPEQIFKKLDADGNGTLDVAELTKSPRIKEEAKAKEILAKWDANKDGKVCIKEFSEALKKGQKMESFAI